MTVNNFPSSEVRMAKNRKARKPLDLRQDRHHILPRVHGGGYYNNIVVLPVRWHAAYHQLFSHMTVLEVHTFIDAVMTPNTEWDYKSLYQLRMYISKGGD